VWFDGPVDGIHDLGGMHGFGPVEREADEPVFHEDWERRTLGMAAATFVSGLGNGGRFRHAIERMDPTHYLSSSYYEHWLTGVATLYVEAGVFDREDLDARLGAPFTLSRPASAPAVDDPGPGRDRPRFAIGDAVRVRDLHPPGHTRCPRYVRGKRGVIARVDGIFSVPDVEAHSDERRHEPTYGVRFEARELWGDAAGDPVFVDLWESYLE
jgi:nitrile hydratase subunit beta